MTATQILKGILYSSLVIFVLLLAVVLFAAAA